MTSIDINTKSPANSWFARGFKALMEYRFRSASDDIAHVDTLDRRTRSDCGLSSMESDRYYRMFTERCLR